MRSIKSFLRDVKFKNQEDSINLKRIPFIQTFIPKNKVGIELGVFRGWFSKLLLKHTHPNKLHLVDPWFKLTPEWHWGGGERSTITALIRILESFRSEIETGKIVVHVDDDLLVLKQFHESSLDWAYIDSSHQYEHTKLELEILDTKIRNSGLIAGDDWHEDENHPHFGVARAVNEFVKKGEWKLIYSNEEDRQWAIQRSLSKAIHSRMSS
jgi:hypothetical protein